MMQPLLGMPVVILPNLVEPDIQYAFDARLFQKYSMRGKPIIKIEFVETEENPLLIRVEPSTC